MRSLISRTSCKTIRTFQKSLDNAYLAVALTDALKNMYTFFEKIPIRLAHK